MRSLVGRQQRNPCENQTTAVVRIYSPRKRGQMLSFSLQATGAWIEPLSQIRNSFLSLSIMFQRQNQFLFSSSVWLFRGLTGSSLFLTFFSFTSILSTLKSFPFSYTYSMQCPPLPECNCWSYRLNPVSLIHGTLYPSSPHSHLDWHLNRNIYRQTLYPKTKYARQCALAKHVGEEGSARIQFCSAGNPDLRNRLFDSRLAEELERLLQRREWLRTSAYTHAWEV